MRSSLLLRKTKLPVLCAVVDDHNMWKTVFAPHIPKQLFTDVVVGTNPTDFDAAVKTSKSSDVPIVMAIMGKNSNAAIRAIATESQRLNWVHSLFTGVDSFKLPTLTDVLDGVPVSNARGVYSNPMAEHVVLSCLYFNRKVWKIQKQKKDKTWDRFASVEMNRQKMGIVGYGDIASACAKAVRSFDMDVTGLRRSAVPEGTVDKHGVKIVNGPAALDKMLAESDFILNLMPNTSENYHMFNKELFAKMKKGAVFINIGRGATMDEDALFDALDSGHLAGAALDVFEVEPLPKESKLWSLPDDKLLMTPHNCDITPTCFQECAQFFGDLATKFVKEGAVPEYLIDIRKGY